MSEQDRAAEDILGRSIRLSLGGRTFVLPVLTIAGNRRWKATLDDQLAGVLTTIRKGGAKTPVLYEVLAGQVDQMVALLRAYDVTNVLPDDLEEFAYEDELVAAVQEVWKAANPLVVTAASMAIAAAMTKGSSEPTSSSPPSTAGSPQTSKTN